MRKSCSPFLYTARFICAGEKSEGWLFTAMIQRREPNVTSGSTNFRPLGNQQLHRSLVAFGACEHEERLATVTELIDMFRL